VAETPSLPSFLFALIENCAVCVPIPSAVLPETLCAQPRKTLPPARLLIGTEDELNRIAESKGESKYPVELEGSVVSINGMQKP
jgi:hypothetical protein